MNKTIRPKLELLSRELIEKILDEAYVLLETEGIFVENREALELFKEAGTKIETQSNRVYPSAALIQDALASTPSEIKMYNRHGDVEYTVGGDEIHFDPGSAAVTLLDHRTQQQRKPDTQDVVNFVRLTDKIDNIDFQSTGLISQDIPMIFSVDTSACINWSRLYSGF